MRIALVTIITVSAAIAAHAQSGRGQESFFNDRYCTRGGNDNTVDCGYNTWQQCIETASGLGRYCLKNPYWHAPREQPTTQGRGHRRTR